MTLPMTEVARILESICDGQMNRRSCVGRAQNCRFWGCDGIQGFEWEL